MFRRGIAFASIVLMSGCGDQLLDPIDRPQFSRSATVTIGGCEFKKQEIRRGVILYLREDCQTGDFNEVPDGSTLDGRNHTISAAVPFSGSAVVQSTFGATSAHVKRVKIDGGGQDGFAGILFGNGTNSPATSSSAKTRWGRRAGPPAPT